MFMEKSNLHETMNNILTPPSLPSPALGSSCVTCHSSLRGGGGCIGRGGGTPLQNPSLCPATVPLTASAILNGICN